MSQSISLELAGRSLHVWSCGPEEINTFRELHAGHAIGVYHHLISTNEDGDEAAPAEEGETLGRDVIGAQLVLRKGDIQKLNRVLRAWESQRDPCPHYHAVQAIAEAIRNHSAGVYVFRCNH